jgi:hypothetical protein
LARARVNAHEKEYPQAQFIAQVERIGHIATGHFATGHFATGHFATGHFAIGHFATGHFATSRNWKEK